MKTPSTLLRTPFGLLSFAAASVVASANGLISTEALYKLAKSDSHLKPIASVSTKVKASSSENSVTNPNYPTTPHTRAGFSNSASSLGSSIDPSPLDPGYPTTPRTRAGFPNSAQGQVAAVQTPPPADSAPTSRALPSPFDSPPWPLADWVTEASSPIGESWDASTGPLQKALVGSSWDKSRIKFYGWIDVGYTASTSNHSNSPLSYDLTPNRPVLDQAVLKIERMPDTVQTSHVDYGFRLTNLYGIDYRFTAADGYFFDQLQKHNMLYGYDPVELFGMIYLPKVAQGMVITAGRYISPPDIEAQLSPQNYLYSHSLMFTVDPYTYTGITAMTRWSKTFTTLTGVQAGNDKAPWEKSGQPNAELMFGFHSPSNNDTLWTGLDSIGSGHFRGGHDDLQIFSTTYGHKFSSLWHNYAQFYYIWEYDGAKGGTEIDGPTEPYAGGGGAGAIIPGMSHSIGAVDYLEYKIDKNTFASYRTDFLDDAQGQRTGYVNDYMSFTLGVTHYFTPTTEFRPEVRFDNAFNNAAFDNGTRKSQWTLAGDLIFKF